MDATSCCAAVAAPSPGWSTPLDCRRAAWRWTEERARNERAPELTAVRARDHDLGWRMVPWRTGTTVRAAAATVRVGTGAAPRMRGGAGRRARAEAPAIRAAATGVPPGPTAGPAGTPHQSGRA